jgi:hypothetical protein
MICVDAAPADILLRPGFKHVVETLDPRYKIPHATTFSRTIIPKLANTVRQHQYKLIKNVLESENSIAFTTDGLDADDVERSALHDFSLYFYKNNKVCAESMFVRRLEPPVTGCVIYDFLKQCLADCNILVDVKPRLSVWGIADEGSNIQRAMKLLQNDGIIEGHHACFNHKLQNCIKDGIKATAGKLSFFHRCTAWGVQGGRRWLQANSPAGRPPLKWP